MSAEPGTFAVQDRGIVAVSCLSKDRSYAVRTNGMVFSVFSSNDSEAALKAAVARLPETGFLQLIRFRWEEKDNRFIAISFPSQTLSMDFNPLGALRLRNSIEAAVERFNAFPNEAFEQVLQFRAHAGLTGENLFKCGGEGLVYRFLGPVVFDGDRIETEKIIGTQGLFAVNSLYGAALDFTAFETLEKRMVPEGAFFSSTTVRRVGEQEANEVRVNTLGSTMFSGHLRREVVNQDEIMRFQPFALSHTVLLLDSSHKSLLRRVEAWAKELLADGVATTRPRLRLYEVLKSALPGQGDLHPSSIYLDQDTCADALVSFLGAHG